MRRISGGFTIIEILVVVAVIGILATISLVGFNRYQADTRDSQRSSKATILSEALEKYYDKNGEYPACPAMIAVASTVTSTTLPGVEQNTLLTPTDTSETNSIKCLSNLTTSDPDVFAYVGDGSAACSSGSSCLAYTLKYKDESSGTIKSIVSRRQASITSSTQISDLNCTAYSFSVIHCTWTPTDNATSYNVQRATNSSFTAGMVQSSVTSTNPGVVSGLTLNTLYYIQVQPVALGVAGSWSNPSSATTFSIDTPNPSCTMNSISQISCTWPPVDNATSYNLDWSTSCSFSSYTTVNPSTSPIVFSGLSTGVTRAIRVKSVASSYSSGYSDCASATTTVPTPTCLTATTNSTIQITASWAACPVSGATSYDLDYSSGNSFNPGTFSTINTASTSQAVAGLTDGTVYYFRVRANIGANTSASSTTVNATTTSVVLSGQSSCSGTYSARPNYRIDFVYYEVSYNIAANTSNITWVFYRTPNVHVSTGTYDQSAAASDWMYNASLDGVGVTSYYSNSGRWRGRAANVGDTEALWGTNTSANSSTSGTITITHNGDGTKTIGTYAYDGYGGVFGTASCSGSYVLSDLR